MSPIDQNFAILVAAGRGARAGGPVAKQWQGLAGSRVIDHTIAAFAAADGIDHIVLVLPQGEMNRAGEFADCICVEGGATRAESVKAGLQAIQPLDPAHVLIHDGARPLVPALLIENVLHALEISDGAAPALPVTDSLWRGTDGQVVATQNRDGLFRAQTPQGFRFKALWAAYETATGAEADDVEVARAAGLDVTIVPGDETNIKLTHPEDFARAEQMTRGRMDIRMGTGYDVHAFEPGDHVVLCGHNIPHTKALKGHSDADVAMHAVTDAIYGALAEGDIGRHFPPSDPQWKGAASDIFLRHAVDLARTKGFEISNIDTTIICEMPKIGPHADAMIERMSKILEIQQDRVSIKATTSERLGFTGREEGIAAMASAVLVSK